MIFLILSAIYVLIILYNRYFPVFGTRCFEWKDLDLDKMKVIDVRDFNDSYRNTISGAKNIPIAYLKRNRNQIPNNDDLVVIASNSLEKNVAIRFLRKKGYRVIGFIIYQDNESYHWVVKNI